MKLDSAVFYTNDIEEIKRFYVEVVGLKLEYQDTDRYVSFVFEDGGRLGINKSVFDREKPGGQTVFITPENIKAEYEKYQRSGHEFFEDYKEYEWGTYFAILDPDGNKVGFIQR